MFIYDHTGEMFFEKVEVTEAPNLHFTKATKEETIPNKNDFVRAPPKNQKFV